MSSIRFPSKKQISNLAARLSPVAKTDCRMITDLSTPSICKICIHNLPTHASKCPKIIVFDCHKLYNLLAVMIMYHGQLTPYLKTGHLTFGIIINHTESYCISYGGYNACTKGSTPMETLSHKSKPSMSAAMSPPHLTQLLRPTLLGQITMHKSIFQGFHCWS